MHCVVLRAAPFSLLTKRSRASVSPHVTWTVDPHQSGLSPSLHPHLTVTRDPQPRPLHCLPEGAQWGQHSGRAGLPPPAERHSLQWTTHRRRCFCSVLWQWLHSQGDLRSHLSEEGQQRAVAVNHIQELVLQGRWGWGMVDTPTEWDSNLW